MSNKALFNTQIARVPTTDTVNAAGGRAYKLSDKQALAQLAVTGCLSQTFYVRPQDQLKEVLELANKVDPVFVAKTALYARRDGFMKDMPALLCAVLLARDPALFEVVAPQVLDNGRMVRNLVQMVRSGAINGQKNLSRPARRFLKNWLVGRNYGRLFDDSVGNDPSIGDIVKMIHPKGKTPEQEALFGYLIDRKVDVDKLPKVVRQYEAFKAGDSTEVPGVEFRLLDSLGLSTNQWADVAKSMRWHALRMNLNTLLRHGVFKDKVMVKYVADKLRDEEVIRKARVMPYQLLTAYLAVAEDNGLSRGGSYWGYSAPSQKSDMPMEIIMAIQDALEIACENVPKFDGHVVIAPDVSGSMSSPITGSRAGQPASKTTCIHVAALVASAVARVNPDAEILPFAHQLYKVRLNPRDSIVTNAQKLIACGGGGTDCSLPLVELNRRKANADVVWYISDYESWIDRHYGNRAGLATEWDKFQRRNKGATLLLNDLTPHSNSQAQEGSKGVYQIGGFSDAVFKFGKLVAESKNSTTHWVDLIEGLPLESN